MTRFLTALLLLAFAAPLSACGLTGELKTPPPIWGGDATAAAASEDETDADAKPTAAETFFETPIKDEIGYGVDVADTP